MSQADANAFLAPYFYFRAKACIYLQKGPVAYRRDDFFHVPRPEWDTETLIAIQRGFQQIQEWKGLTAATALDGVGLEDLYRLMEITHFQLENFTAEQLGRLTMVGTVRIRHRVDGYPLQLKYMILTEPALECSYDGIAQRPCETFGYTPDNPIRCWEPRGERLYLKRLRCPNGHPYSFRRCRSLFGKCPDIRTHIGDIGTNDATPELCIVDEYSLECSEGEHTCALYTDMYHPDFSEQVAPVGLFVSPES
jgi:hypothetical protein